MKATSINPVFITLPPTLHNTFIMATSLVETLRVKYPDQLPPWVDPFPKAVQRMEILEKREKDGTVVTSENKRPTRVSKKKATKMIKSSRKRKEIEVDDSEEAVVEEDDDGKDDDDGLGDQVEDQDMFKKVEEYLESAIELSGQTEALPYIWMTELRLKFAQYPRATEAAFKAALLEPLSPTILFRLSACFVHQKEFVQAHTFYNRAVSLLPVSEREQYLAKLKRLREQSVDQQNAVFKEDPFEIFPLEVIIRIMELGCVDSDPDFVLRMSWTNRRWRAVLINNCPELWKTLTFSHTGFIKKTWEAKSAEWVKRAAGRIDTLVFDDMSSGAADRVSRKQARYLADARTLMVEARGATVLSRLARKLEI
ncbi:hypothetical protein NCC49_004190 [Naganishia albida]|nr:hypothetical protein NCC49_004190 [Naganishia albida]